jgi:hypothetical protein
MGLVVAGIILLPLMLFPLRQINFIFQSSELKKIDVTSEKLEILNFPESEFSQIAFEKNGREFRYQGKMYDVHSISRSGDHFVILALKDTRELRLLLAFQQKDSNTGSDRPATPRLGFMPYFAVDVFSPDLQTNEPTQLYVSYLAERYLEPGFRSTSPPPELLTSI